MNVKIEPESVQGTIDAIPSKSHLHRLLICAAIAKIPREILVKNLEAEDIKATMKCLQIIGARFDQYDHSIRVRAITRTRKPSECVLPVGESGSTLRFLLPVVAALGITATFEMEGRLPERPLHPLDEQLTKHGITITRPTPTTLRTCGQLQAGDYVLPGNVSSQYISGLLMALPLLKQRSTLEITGNIESESYIDLTLAAQQKFRMNHFYNQQKFTITETSRYGGTKALTVDGDWSNGAFWLVCGAMRGSSVTLNKISKKSLQGDRKITDILLQLGATVRWRKNQVTVTGNRRQAVDIDASGIPDLIPVLAAVLSVAEGTSRITNAGRLRMKESDRLATTAATLNTLGAKVTELEDGLIIEGVPNLKGGTVDAHNDHRIAMCAAVAALACTEPVIITGAEAVNKSYPQLWADFAKLGGMIDVDMEK